MGGDDVHANTDCLFLVFLLLILFWCGTLVGRGGGWGVMTSIRMRLLGCISFVILYFVHWWGDVGVGTRGMGGTDDVHANSAHNYYFSFCPVKW